MNGNRRHWPWIAGLALLVILGGGYYLGWFGLGGAGWMPGYGMGQGYGFGMGPGYGRGWFHMGFGGLPMIIFWVLIVVVVWGLATSLSGSRSCGTPPAPPAPPANRALDILQERYAKGELSKEQYQEMRRDLQA